MGNGLAVVSHKFAHAYLTLPNFTHLPIISNAVLRVMDIMQSSFWQFRKTSGNLHYIIVKIYFDVIRIPILKLNTLLNLHNAKF